MSLAPTSCVTAAGAQKAIEAGVAHAEKQGWKVCVAVVDAGGYTLAVKRMDGCNAVAGEVSQGKARSAAKFSIETKNLEGVVNGNTRNEGGERTALVSVGHILMEGGVPIVDPAHGRVVGACGVSGVQPQQDAEVAKAMVAAVLAPTSKL
eukprot:TRINITY_DN49661_c0_g1_i1.p1 TRINITY_DN49661_c0_g1~~TRINITY_DN49661_c0_g1_i1.p1  ORF type:complete len:150 (-),score=46.35 TRINITY_DN49661_c0_g1_i1:38-487(-)